MIIRIKTIKKGKLKTGEVKNIQNNLRKSNVFLQRVPEEQANRMRNAKYLIRKKINVEGSSQKAKVAKGKKKKKEGAREAWLYLPGACCS